MFDFHRVFDSRELGSATYGMALAALCREQNLSVVAGEGTFSDVYATVRTELDADANASTPSSTFGTLISLFPYGQLYDVVFFNE